MFGRTAFLARGALRGRRCRWWSCWRARYQRAEATIRRIATALLLLAALPVSAQEPAPEPSILSGAAWCVVHTREPAESEPGCDIGAGIALQRWRRLSWVAVVGAETLGTGLAWIAHRPERGPVVAVAAGVVVRYDSTGISAGEVYPALGATLSFGRTPE